MLQRRTVVADDKTMDARLSRHAPARLRRGVRSASLLAALLVGAVPLAGAGAAVAAPAPLRAATSLVLDGHGNGHGIGLSQWGAYGYAVDLGWTSAQILDHYYGGTVAASVTADEAANPVAVRLMRLDDQQTAVVHDRGQLVVDGVPGGPWGAVLARETTPGGYTVWARGTAACPLDSDTTLADWTPVASGLASVTIRPQVDTSTSADPADLAAVCEPAVSGGKVRSYRGAIRAVNGTDGENRTVNLVPLEQYLRPIVATEMSASWAAKGGGRGAQALQAQAVAARSYGLAEHRYSYAATCDLVCQSYPGAATRSSLGGAYTSIEQPPVDLAVAATAGVVRRVGTPTGPVALTMFSASSGGWTAASTLPFPAVVDEGDATSGNPAHDWSVTVATSTLEAAWPAIGTFQDLAVTRRTGQGEWGGRVVSAVLSGSSGSVTVTGDQLRRVLGLKSNWFALHGTTSDVPSGGPAVPVDRCGGRNGTPVTDAPSTAPPARFVPMAPLRLVDTRDGLGASAAVLAANCTLVVDPGVGEDSTAVAVNITTVEAQANGFLTAFPCGVERPFTATVQPLIGQIVGGTALVPLGSDGTFCVFSNVATHVVVDLFGVYSPDASSRFEPIHAQRRFDSKANGRRVDVGETVRVAVTGFGAGGADTTAVALTVQLSDAQVGGFVTAWPCGGDAPFVSAANVASGGSVTNHLEVAVGASGEVCFSVNRSMHLAVDLVGWFGPTATTEFHAVTPFRLADTREGLGWPGAFTRDTVRPISVVGVGSLPGADRVRAVAAQFTAVDAVAAGAISVDACRPSSPRLSILRHPATRNVAALVTGIVTDAGAGAAGRWCVTASAATQVVVDVTGWFG